MRLYVGKIKSCGSVEGGEWESRVSFGECELNKKKFSRNIFELFCSLDKHEKNMYCKKMSSALYQTAPRGVTWSLKWKLSIWFFVVSMLRPSKFSSSSSMKFSWKWSRWESDKKFFSCFKCSRECRKWAKKKTKNTCSVYYAASYVALTRSSSPS